MAILAPKQVEKWTEATGQSPETAAILRTGGRGPRARRPPSTQPPTHPPPSRPLAGPPQRPPTAPAYRPPLGDVRRRRRLRRRKRRSGVLLPPSVSVSRRRSHRVSGAPPGPGRQAGRQRGIRAAAPGQVFIMASSSWLDEEQLRNLKGQYEAQNAKIPASQIQELVDCISTLKIRVGILGGRGAGVSTLIRALLDKPRWVNDPWAYFRDTPEPTKQLVEHIHPTYPNLTLCDLPGFEASEKPAAYLKRLGDLSKYSCFVVVVSGSLGETHLQVLKAFKQKGKSFLLARTKVDLDLHTAERRLRFRYNPGEQLGLIRKELTETLAKNQMDTKRVFLVSGLVAEKYEFSHFEDSLEGEVLSLKRSHDGDLEDLKAISSKKIEELYNICQNGSLAEVPAVILSALREPSQIRLDVAVIGEAGCGKSSLVNALRGLAAGESGAAPTGVTGTTRKATVYPFPLAPYLYLWDLPGVGVTEEDMRHLDLSRYDFFLLVASERYKHAHSCLARAIAAAGKESFFVRSKIDVDVETQPGNQPIPEEKLQEQVRKRCTEALKKDGILSPQVFLVSSLGPKTYDLPLLQEALSHNSADLKRKALRRAIPMVLSRLVRRKSKVLMKDVWVKALQICLYCVEKPNLEVTENLKANITSFCIDLGLDEESLEVTAQVTGKPLKLLQGQIRSPLTKPLDSQYLLRLITKPVPLASWAWSYVPYLGRGADLEPKISFESTYGMLKQVVVELTGDAERVLHTALAEE